jgi:hypothetical protein
MPKLSTRLLLLLAAGSAFLAGCGARPRAAGEPLVLTEHYAHSLAAIGWPGTKRSFQIGNGSVAGSGEAGIQWALTSPTGAVTTSPVYFERDGVPIAHWWVTSAQESLHFEAAAVPSALLGDSSLVLVVRVTTTWLDHAPGLSVLEARVVVRAEGPSFTPWDIAPETSFVEAWSGDRALRNGRAVAVFASGRGGESVSPTVSKPATTTERAGSLLIAHYRTQCSLHTHDVREFVIPAYPVAPEIAAAVAKQLSFDRAAAISRAAWRGLLARGATFATPDSLLNAAWRSSLVVLLTSQERAASDTLPIGNPFQYRDIWLRDGAQVVRALAVAGQTNFARANAWGMRRFQLSSGVLISQAGQLDGTGQTLWAMTQAASLPPDPAYAARVLPIVANGLTWIEHQRLAGRLLRQANPGLLPWSKPRDNEMVSAQLVGNDAWSFSGEKGALALARLAGDRELESRALAAIEDYRLTFDSALVRTKSADVPPSWQGIGRDWGNLTVGYPARLLPESDPRLAALAARVWGMAGGPGLTTYGTRDSLHTYVAADLAQWALLADRGADARAVLNGMLAHGSSTLGFAEIFSRANGSFGTNLPPHGTAAARLIQLARDLVVFDVRDTLELALGVPPTWWGATRMERAPTRFGVITVTLDRPAATRLEAHWSAVAVPTRIRVPDGVRAVAVLTPGARIVGDHWIECPPQTTRAVFEVAPAAVP